MTLNLHVYEFAIDVILRFQNREGENVTKGVGMPMDSPEYGAMKEIVHSPAGRKAALDATNAGRPALDGVDPLLQAALNKNYNEENLDPLNAGYEVAAVMRDLGYIEAGRGAWAEGCVAKSGRKWNLKG
jgi:hypothetical protein